MKDFAVTFTLTVMGRRATPLIMEGFPVTFTLLSSPLRGSSSRSVPYLDQTPRNPWYCHR